MDQLVELMGLVERVGAIYLSLDQVSEAQARGECGLRWPRAERGGFSDGACSDSHVQ